jgi:hypothetical protein
VLETCVNGWYLEDIKDLPLYSYPHILDNGCLKGSNQQQFSFPHLYYCNGCYNNYFWWNTWYPDSNVMGRNFRDHRGNSVPLLTELGGFDNYGNFTCHRRNHLLNSIKEKQYCFVSDYVVSVLKDKLYFTKNPLNLLNTDRSKKPHGLISELIYDEFVPGEAPWNFLLTDTEMVVTYFDFNPPQTNKITFRAWWAPYRKEVWATLLMGFCSLTIVFAYYRLCVKSRSNHMSKVIRLLTFLRSWSDTWLEVIRFVLRQDDTSSFFLITCSYFMLIFTCLY